MINNGKKISMKDIARELNISITTVSFVVNGKSEQRNISPATVKRVNDLIEKWDFNPNSAARLLRTGKSNTIGLIIEDISNYFFGNVAKIIEMEAHKNGFNVFFSSTENNDTTAKDLIQKMMYSQVDGFIITPTKGLKSDVLKLQKERIPFVLLDRLVPGVEASYVVLDNYKGAVELTTHLINNGYTRIGFVSIVSSMSQMVDRKRGLTDTLQASGIQTGEEDVLEIIYGKSDEESITAIATFLTDNANLDALFFATNYLGVFGIEALQRCKLKVPEDLAIVCFDDNDIFRLMTPSITVAAQPIKQIAGSAIAVLLQTITHHQQQPPIVEEILSPELIVRDSSPVKANRKKI